MFHRSHLLTGILARAVTGAGVDFPKQLPQIEQQLPVADKDGWRGWGPLAGGFSSKPVSKGEAGQHFASK